MPKIDFNHFFDYLFPPRNVSLFPSLMGIIQKDAVRTMIISYIGIILGYLNKGLLFLIILTTEQIGLVNLILTVGLLFAQIANFGSVYTTWKFLPFFKNQEKKHHGFLPLMALIVLLGIILCTALALVFRPQIEAIYIERSAEFIKYYYWFIPIGIGYVIFMLLESYLRGFYKNIIAVFSFEIVLRLGITFLLIFYWLKWINFDDFVIIHSFMYLIPSLVLVIYLIRLKEFNLRFSSINISKRFRKIIIQYSSYNYINTLGAVLVQSLDIIMIAQFIGLEATGVYATIVFLASALQVPYRSIIRISSPLVADYWKHREMDKMQELYTKVSSVSLVIGLSSFMLLWMNIDFLFSFLKPEFQDGIWVFFFLMMGRLLDMFFGLNGFIFSTSKKYKYDILFTLFLIVAVYGLNLFFIPEWGIIGAAISTGISVVVYNIGRILFVWKVYKIHPFQKNQFIIIGLGIVTILTWNLISPWIQNNWLNVSFALLYFCMTFFVPILVFNLELELKNYFKKGWTFLMKK